MARPNNGPRLARNERGVYEIRWSENGRSRRLSTRQTTQAQAHAVLAGFLSERIEESSGAAMTVGHVVDVYEREHVDTGGVADQVRQKTICDWLRRGLGRYSVDELTPDRVQDYGYKRRTGAISTRGTRGRRGRNGVSDATIRRELSTLVAALNHAARTRRIAREQVPYIPLPTAPNPREFWLTRDECNDLQRFARRESDAVGRLTRVDRFVHIALATGARKSAILELPWELVDMGAGLIRFDRLANTRTKKRRAAVPIADWLRPTLERAWAERQGELVMDVRGDIRRAVEALCRRVARETGNRRFLSVHPHVLRHTAATHMVQAGVDLFAVAGVLGDTLATVTRVYAHHSPDYLRSAVAATGPAQKETPR